MVKYFSSKQFDGKFRKQRILANVNVNKLLKEKLNTLLYIGARPNRIDNLDLFAGFNVTILEVWHKNVVAISNNKCDLRIKKNISKLNNLKVVEGDIYDFNSGIYDVVMWWHGPEHVDQSRLDICIDNCINTSSKYTIIGCPWGDYKEHHFNNPYENHVSSLQPEYFERKGFYVEVMGKEGPGSNIMSVYKK